jgi:hypothetical protein
MKACNLLAMASLLSCCLIGCNGQGSNAFPKANVDPHEVASKIMAEYDVDGNGELSAAEIKKCPGLVMLTAGQEQLLPEYRLDKDSSGTISESEFAEKLAECLNNRRQGFHCVVLYRGRPLQGATVTLVPESFMGDVPRASGETDQEGTCGVSTADGMEGAVPGIYRVEITHPTVNISPRFNSESTISVALDPTNPYATAGIMHFDVR